MNENLQPEQKVFDFLKFFNQHVLHAHIFNTKLD